MLGGHNLKSGYAMTANTVRVKRNFSISIYIKATGKVDEWIKSLAWKANVPLKAPGVRISPLPPFCMSHGPISYLRIRHGYQGKNVGHGCWFNGFVKPSTRLEKRRASKRVRRAADVPNGKAFRKEWGYWEWC